MNTFNKKRSPCSGSPHLPRLLGSPGGEESDGSVALELSSVANAPDAMLTATQISAINRAEAIISTFCTV
jgi:hypothetical protein